MEDMSLFLEPKEMMIQAYVRLKLLTGMAQGDFQDQRPYQKENTSTYSDTNKSQEGHYQWSEELGKTVVLVRHQNLVTHSFYSVLGMVCQ